MLTCYTHNIGSFIVVDLEIRKTNNLIWIVGNKDIISILQKCHIHQCFRPFKDHVYLRNVEKTQVLCHREHTTCPDLL